jgi:hypothetical protein
VAGYYDTDSSASFDGDVIYFMPLTITAAQSVVNITVNMAGFNIAALQCALYADDGSGRPGALLATSDAIDVGTLNPALSGPITMDIGGAGGVALSAGTAWLGILGTTGSGYTLVASAEQDSDFQYLDAASFPASVGAAATDEGGGFGALAVDLNACAVAPTPVPTALPQGIACTCGCQCASGHCVNGHCCNNACASTCQACAMALTGQPDGTCANMFAGSPAPSGECPIGAACGNTGNCGPGGVCEVAHSGTVCTGGTCNGTGSCIP